MEYKIKTGEEFSESFLEEIMDIDREVYGEISEEYVGELVNLQVRYQKNKKTFVCVMDGDRIAGYINFFPVVRELWEGITENDMYIHDDEITPEQVLAYSEGEQHDIYILSIAIRKQYQNQKSVVKTLTDGFIQYLNELKEEGIGIRALAGTAVSKGGRKYLRNCMFGERRKLADGNVVYVCEEEYLEKFLANDLYFKTHKDDVYLFIPYVENPKNDKLNTLIQAAMEEKKQRKALRGLESEGTEEESGDPSDEETVDGKELVRSLMDALEECWDYEYQSDVVEEVTRIYLGDFELMHTLDLYPDDDSVPTHIVGEEKVYLSLLAHRNSHMYIAMVFVPNCQYSTSQLEDQVCQECLYIRHDTDDFYDRKGHYLYCKLNDYMKEEYGLMQCGKGKSIVCMSNRPQDEQELMNILAAESYNSMRQGFHIYYDKLRNDARNNRAIYDYYEAYMTEAVVAVWLKDFDLGGTERVELMATYVFIVEMVMFQNIALNRVINKVTNALSYDGDVDYDYILQLNEDYAKTMKFWQSTNFKYFGTQREADQIRRAFDNDELRAQYRQQQDFLEHMVEVKDAKAEHRNGMLMNIVLFALAIMEVRDYAVEILAKLFERVGLGIVAESSAYGTFDTILFGFGPLALLGYFTWKKKRERESQKRLRNKNAMEENDE